MQRTVDIRVKLLAGQWLGWRYGRVEMEAPYPVRGWPTSLLDTGSRVVDCSTMTTWMIMALYPNTSWSSADYAKMQIFEADDPWSPIDAVVSKGSHVAIAVSEPVVGSWHLCQTWEGRPGYSSGHSRLAYYRTDGSMLTLESTISGEADGPQWRVLPWVDLKNRGGGCRLARLM